MLEEETRTRGLSAFMAALEEDGRPHFPLQALLTSRAKRDVRVRSRAIRALYDLGWTRAQLAALTGMRPSSIYVVCALQAVPPGYSVQRQLDLSTSDN